MTIETSVANPKPRGWSTHAIATVAICLFINMLDGVDLAIIAYIGPALARDWNLGPAELGLVFSGGLVGMAIGCLFIAPMADRYGRGPLLLAALSTITVSTIACGYAPSLELLIAARGFTGLGIGIVMSCLTALAAEAAPPEYRNWAVGIVQCGNPIAAVLTGIISADLTPVVGWRAMMIGTGLLTMSGIPFALLLYRWERQAGTPASRGPVTGAVVQILSTRYRSETLKLWLTAVVGVIIGYAVVSWIPKISVDSGFTEAEGIYAGVLYGVGAFFGTLLMSFGSLRLRLQRLIPIFYVAAATVIVAFGALDLPLWAMWTTAFLIGVSLQGGYNGSYALAVGIYPAAVRATGIGWATGIARFGAIFGPVFVGFLLAAHLSVGLIFGIFGAMLLVGAIASSAVRFDRP